MPERIVTNFAHWREQVSNALLFWAIGASIGIGQHLLSSDRFSWRVVIGRALSNGGLAVVAGVALVPHPDMQLLSQIGLAAGIASLGTNSLELAFRRYIIGRSAE